MPENYAPTQVRRDRDIHEADGGWYYARWHFSFEKYHDPNNMGIGKLRLLNHDTLVPNVEWPMHPHADIEGITYVVAGTFEHRDNLGNGGLLPAGSVQRMTLGSGAEHAERNPSPTEPMQFIQMWIFPNRHFLPPSVEQCRFTAEDRHNRLLQIVHPEDRAGTGVMVHQDASVYVARLDSGAAVEHTYDAGRGGYFYVISGAVTLNDERLTTGDAAKVLEGGLLRIRAEEPSELILVDTPLAWAMMV